MARFEMASFAAFGVAALAACGSSETVSDDPVRVSGDRATTADAPETAEQPGTQTTDLVLAPVPAGDARLDAAHYFSEGVAVDNLTVWPVYADTAGTAIGVPDRFLSLHEAVRDGHATVREVGEGTVGELVVTNHGDLPILAPSGSIVKGGKQDRQLGRDTVILAGGTERVQAFCVEQGRWTQTREGEDTGGKFEALNLLAAKRVRTSGQYDRDQSEVWSNVALLSNVAYQVADDESSVNVNSLAYLGYDGDVGHGSSTGTLLAAIEDGQPDPDGTKARMAGAVTTWFDLLEGELRGFAYCIDGEPVSVRIFATRDLLRSQQEAYFLTMAYEAGFARSMDLRAGREPHRKPAEIEAVVALVAGIGAGELSVDIDSETQRVESRSNGFGGNSVCRLKLTGEPVVLTQDWTAPVSFGEEALQVLGQLEALGYVEE